MAGVAVVLPRAQSATEKGRYPGDVARLRLRFVSVGPVVSQILVMR
jgi:hypothetical protein